MTSTIENSAPVFFRDGKKYLGEKALYSAFRFFLKKKKKNINPSYTKKKDKNLGISIKNLTPLIGFTTGTCVQHLIKNLIYTIRPQMDVRKVRYRGRTNLIPIRYSLRTSMARTYQWIKESIKRYDKKRKHNVLGEIFYQCATGKGYFWQKKKEAMKLWKTNKSNLRFRWW